MTLVIWAIKKTAQETVLAVILENPINVILVIIAIEGDGSMKKTAIWASLLIVPWIVICVLQFIVQHSQKEPSAFYDYLFPALSALYTGFSVIVAYRNLVEEKESLIRQTKISVFSEAMHLLANDNKYQEALEYILSGSYGKDVKTVQKVLGTKKKIGLVNFWEILYQNLRTEGITLTEEEKKELSKSYEKIKYFCLKMEYLGIISEDEFAGALIMELYGITIEDTYNIVGSLVENSKGQYKHFTQLYNRVKESKQNANG